MYRFSILLAYLLLYSISVAGQELSMGEPQPLRKGFDEVSPSGLEEKIKYYERALTGFRAGKDFQKVAWCLQQLGDLHAAQGRLVLAQSELLQSLELYKVLHYPDLQGVYDLLAANEADQGNYLLSVKYSQLAEQTARARGDSTQLRAIYNRLGLAYQGMDSLTSAGTYFDRAFELAMRLRDTGDAMIVAWNMEANYTRQARYENAIDLMRTLEMRFPVLNPHDELILNAMWVNAYVLYKKPLAAAPYMQKMMEVAEEVPKKNYVREAMYRAAIRYFLLIANYHAAAKYCMDYEALCKLTGNNLGLSENYLWRFKADSALGNFSAAIRQYQLYKTTRDSLFSDNRTLMAAKYEVTQREKDQLLREQQQRLLSGEDQLQKDKREKANLVRLVAFAGVIILLLVGFIFFYARHFSGAHKHQVIRLQREINRQKYALESLINAQHKLLGEKEWLLKEIHHRVKNNLQIVMSLLNTQSAHLHDDAAISAIHESRRRMQAISLIHQKLYQEENVSVVDIDAYIHELVSYVSDGFSNISRIYFDIRIIPLALDISQAVPIGLILNEALTNAIKYAFEKNKPGTVCISMAYLENRDLLLTVSDNGRGLPPGFDIDKNGAMGITLMHTLSRQLNGSLQVSNNNGFSVMVTFTPPRESTVLLPPDTSLKQIPRG